MSLSQIPFILLDQIVGPLLEVLVGGQLALVNVLGQAIREGLCLHVQLVVLVGELG